MTVSRAEDCCGHYIDDHKELQEGGVKKIGVTIEKMFRMHRKDELQYLLYCFWIMEEYT